MVKFFNHNNYPKAIIKVRPSKLIKGEVGVFALKNFKKNDIVVKADAFKDDNRMSIGEYNKLDKDTKNLVKAHSTIEIDKLYVPENINHINTTNFFNHSCNPNIGFNNRDDYIAMKNVSNGTELLLDYSFLNTNPNYKIKCFCKSKNCRGTITGNEWKKKEFIKKFRKYFATTLKEMI